MPNFKSIPYHSDQGGIGKLFNDSSSGASGDHYFIGGLKKLSFYLRTLSDEEIEKY